MQRPFLACNVFFVYNMSRGSRVSLTAFSAFGDEFEAFSAFVVALRAELEDRVRPGWVAAAKARRNSFRSPIWPQATIVLVTDVPWEALAPVYVPEVPPWRRTRSAPS